VERRPNLSKQESVHDVPDIAAVERIVLHCRESVPIVEPSNNSKGFKINLCLTGV